MLAVLLGDAVRPPDEPEASPVSARRAQGTTLRWALERAVAAARSGLVLITIDDVDRLDGVSQAALAAALSGAPIPGLVVAVTSEQPSGRWAPVHVKARQLVGLAREDTTRWLEAAGWQASTLRQLPAELEPLQVDLLARWWDAPGGEGAPALLVDLVEWRLRGLAALEVRVLQAVATLGRARLSTLAEVLEYEGDLGAPLAALGDAALVVEEGGIIRLQHAVFGRVALALAPRRAIVDLHARAAASPAITRRTELQAHHALRGRPDAGALLAVEEAARLRLGLGDEAGAVQLLGRAFQAARGEVLAGELDAASGWAPLGRRLAALLVDAGGADEAYGVLRELLQHLDPAVTERALVAEQLAQVARRRGRNEEAEALLREALALAESLGEEAVATRLRLAADPSTSGVRSSARGSQVARVMAKSGEGGGR